MGRTAEEAANRIFGEMYNGLKKGYQYIEPVIRSVYRGDPKIVQQAILMGQSQLAALTTVSAWHTAFCIAFDRFDPAAIADGQALFFRGIRPPVERFLATPQGKRGMTLVAAAAKVLANHKIDSEICRCPDSEMIGVQSVKMLLGMIEEKSPGRQVAVPLKPRSGDERSSIPVDF